MFLLFLSHLLFSPQSPSLYSPLETKINITGSPFMLVMCVCSLVCVLFCYIIPDANLILFYFDGLFLAVAPCQLHALSACIGMTDIRAWLHGCFFFFLCATLLGIIVIFFLIGKLDRIWIGSSLGVWESIVNLRTFVWRGLKCFSITLIALFIGDEKQTIRFISVGLVCLMNSFCCTLSSWQTIANVCFIFLSPPLFLLFFLRSIFSVFRSISTRHRPFFQLHGGVQGPGSLRPLLDAIFCAVWWAPGARLP